MIEEPVEILLIEDNPDDIELALRVLRTHKLANSVRVLRDGAEALDFIFGRGVFDGRDIRNRPKVILLDLKLPKIDGLGVLREIKKDPHTKIIPVVVLTSSKEEQDIIESYQLGVNSYITKPVDFEQFIESIRQIGLYWLLMNHAPHRNE